MFVTIITDCSDQNAQGRQVTRVRALFDQTPAFIALPNTESASLEASGNIIDVLDAASGDEGVIIAHTTPQRGKTGKAEDAEVFGYFRYRRTLIVATITERMLSLPKKLGLIEEVEQIDMPATLLRMWEGGIVSEDQVHHIQLSPFQSLDFVPRVALWITRGHEPVSVPFEATHVPDAAPSVWAIDAFGNLKTTLWAQDLTSHDPVVTRFGTLPVIPAPQDVPVGTAALTIGSSGLGEKRFLEVVMPGKSAAATFGCVPGDEIFEK